MNIEQAAALANKEFCSGCHKFATWDECSNCCAPICDECQLEYEGKTRCAKCHAAVVGDDGHIDDCASFCGEPCTCWVKDGGE